MVEAAMLYPIVIGTIMCVIYIIINMYTLLGCNVILSLELRQKMFEETETGTVVQVAETLKNTDSYTVATLGKERYICVTQEGLRKKIDGSIVSHGRVNSLLKSLCIEVNKSRWLVDEKEYIRTVDLINK